jgi:hypothetical protein
VTRHDPPQSSGQRARQTEVIMRAIERYVAAHPQAGDTLTGVRDWWLSEWTTTNEQTVQAALDKLVEAGRMQTRRLPGGRTMYGRDLEGGRK